MQKTIYSCLFSLCLLTQSLFAQRICPEPSPQQREEINTAVAKWQKNHPYAPKRSIDTIAVVVHIIYKTPQENIADSVVISQIDALNADFNRLNADSINTPAPFAAVAGKANIWFKLAVVDTNGNPTTGITRTQTAVTSFTQDNKMKFTAQGGEDVWDAAHYFNIWVCNMSNALLGYAQFPNGAASTDGVVIHYQVFGTNNPVPAMPYDKGRTATHETGHYFGLLHINGDDGASCTGTDSIADTPNQEGMNFGCPTFPVLDACSPNFPGTMFMNYLDYSDDACMNLFTQGQVGRMTTIIDTFRSSLRNSYALGNTTKNMAQYSPNLLRLFPNPAEKEVNVSFLLPKMQEIELNISDIQGKTCQKYAITAQKGENSFNIPVESLEKGIYLLQIKANNIFSCQKLMIN